ncbi:MAG: tyrosine-type recombinase/integrase [Ostreibacterium sp.]
MSTTDLTQCFIATVKSGLPRHVYLGRPAQQALRTYLLSREIVITNNSSLKSSVINQPVFMSQKKNPLSYTAVKNVVQKLSMSRIGMAVTPHMFRHTFATEMLRATGNIRALQLMLGHRSIDSTMRYCHLDLADRE